MIKTWNYGDTIARILRIVRIDAVTWIIARKATIIAIISWIVWIVFIIDNINNIMIETWNYQGIASITIVEIANKRIKRSIAKTQASIVRISRVKARIAIIVMEIVYELE